MPDSEDGKPKGYVQPPPSMVARASSENRTAPAGIGPSSVLRRWKREDMLRKGGVALQGSAFLFSLLAFIITASNEHGGWTDFHKYEEYRYLLAATILSSLYTGIQAFRHIHKFFTGNGFLHQRTSAVIDFCGDQLGSPSDLLHWTCWNVDPKFAPRITGKYVNLTLALLSDAVKFVTKVMAYLLISAATAAIPLTDRMREGGDDMFTDSSAAAIAMAFLAFFSLALSAIISGYKLSTQSYI